MNIMTSQHVARQDERDEKDKNSPGACSGSLSRATIAFALLSLVVLSFGLRMLYAHGQSITFDEYYEIQLAKDTVPEIIQRGDGFPPLYALTMHAWDKVVGSESGRYLSMILAAMGVVAMYRLGAVVDSPKVGLFAAAWLTVLPIHLWYTAEIRAYPLLLLIATLALTSFLQALESNAWRDWVVFSLFTALGLHTHYLFALFPALTLSISLLFRRDIKPFAAGAMILGMTIPFTLLWLEADQVMQEGYTYQRAFDLPVLAFTYGSYFLGYTLGPSRAALHGMPSGQALLQVLPWAAAFSVCLGTIGLLAVKKVCWARREIVVLLFLLVTPVMIGLACTVLQTGYNDRYAIWTLIPLIVLLGIFTRHAWANWLGKVAILGLLLLFATAIFNRHQLDSQRNDDLAAAAEFITSGEHGKLPVLVVSGYMVEPLKYYIDADAWSLEAIPMTSPYDNRRIEMAQILNRMQTKSKDYWLLYTREFHEDNDGMIYQQIDATSQLELAKEFAGVKIYRATFDAQ